MRCDCPDPRDQDWREGTTTWTYTVAGRDYTGNVRADVCAGCGRALVPGSEIARRDLEVSAELLERAPHGDAFKFIRKTLGLSLAEVAEALLMDREALLAIERGASVPDLAWAWIQARFSEHVA